MAGTDFSLGTDPEALLVAKRTGRIKSPSDILYDPDPHNENGQARAIGKDGNRDTSSFELRPGQSQSGLELTNRLADLIGRMAKHYHPPGIAYKAGAYWTPEPLGGHIHLSWPKTGDRLSLGYADHAWQVLEILKGFAAKSEFLIPHLFLATEVKSRIAWAKQNGRDFADPRSTRPETLDQILKEAHVEYRYPPSWLDTPEAAYCFLGGAEFIVRTVLDQKVGTIIEWDKFVAAMFTDAAISPPGSPSLALAFAVARQHVSVEDFAGNWI